MLNTARNSSVDSFDSAENDGPGPIDSTSALVLVPENDDSDIPYHFSSDDEEDGELDSSEIDWLSSSATSLSSSTVFLYLLSPFLTLGALFVPDATNTISIKFTIPALCIFALLSAFARYIWYMLARYVRKATMEDIVVNAFARTQRGETRRDFIKHVVKLGDAILRIFLALTFLRGELKPTCNIRHSWLMNSIAASVDVLLPISPPRLLFLSSRIVLTVILALSVSPLCLSSSFASRRVVIPTAVSVVTYVAWLASTAYSHATGSLDISASWVEMGSLWDAISTPFSLRDVVFAQVISNSCYRICIYCIIHRVFVRVSEVQSPASAAQICAKVFQDFVVGFCITSLGVNYSIIILHLCTQRTRMSNPGSFY